MRRDSWAREFNGKGVGWIAFFNGMEDISVTVMCLHAGVYLAVAVAAATATAAAAAAAAIVRNNS